MRPEEVAARVREVVQAHDRWRATEALNLNAADNVLSARARALLDSDMATRVSEGFPGDKDFPADRQNRFVDEIEATLIHLLKRLFGAKHVEWRPVSTSMANLTVFAALLSPGDVMMTQPEWAGGNYSYNVNGPPGPLGLHVDPLPFHEDGFEVDLEAAVAKILVERPRMIVVGGSNVLFPYPVEALREAADRVGAILLYDAAHVSLLIAAGQFQQPLAEGAHLMTASTHKLLSGAVGGFVLTDDEALAERVYAVSFPSLLQTRDQNKYAATAHALAEMCEHGAAYARQTVENARALGEALEREGFDVLCSDRGYTATHQVFALIPELSAVDFEDLCQRAGLLVTRAQRMGRADRPGIRLTTQEAARRGMTAADMPQIARWLRRVIVEGARPETVAMEVRERLSGSGPLAFSFDGNTR